MKTLPNSPATQSAIAHLLEQKYYVGSISSKGFILKRNFGTRRLPIYGKLISEGSYEIQAKNELIHQIAMSIGMFSFGALAVVLFFQERYGVGVLLLMVTVLVHLSDLRQRKKEVKTFIEYLENANKNKA